MGWSAGRVTCPGQSFAGRVAGSVLNAVGLPELIASSPDGYETLALELATNGGRLSEIKAKLRANRETQPLFGCARFCRQLEAAYETMVEKWRAGETPAPITVTSVR
jgi:protein O-GlcNAc transferase